MAEYGSMYIVSALGAILFFGGWNGPIPIFHWIGWAYSGVGETPTLAGWLANLFGCGNLILKSVVGVTVMIWVRWTLPRLRIDQVITTCWKYCVPLASVMFVGVLIYTATDTWSPNDLFPHQSRASVREGWISQDQARSAGNPEEDEEQAAHDEDDLARTSNQPGEEFVLLARSAEERK